MLAKHQQIFKEGKKEKGKKAARFLVNKDLLRRITDISLYIALNSDLSTLIQVNLQ